MCFCLCSHVPVDALISLDCRSAFECCSTLDATPSKLFADFFAVKLLLLDLDQTAKPSLPSRPMLVSRVEGREGKEPLTGQ